MLGRRDVIILSTGAALASCTQIAKPKGGEMKMTIRFEQFKRGNRGLQTEKVEAVIGRMTVILSGLTRRLLGLQEG